MPVLKLARRNVGKNWRRSAASILAITSGFVAACLFDGFILDLKQLFADILHRQLMISDVVIQKEGSLADYRKSPLGYPLTPADQAFIDGALEEEAARVETRVRFLTLGGMVSNGISSASFVGYGYDLAEGMKVRGPGWEWNTLAGRPLHQVDPGPNLVIGRELGYLIGCEAEGDPPIFLPGGGLIPEERPFECESEWVQLQVTAGENMYMMDAEVVGIADSGLREADDEFMVMPLDVAQELMSTQDVSLYTVQLTDPGERDRFIADLQGRIAAAGAEVEVLPWQDHPLWGDLYRRSVSLLDVFRLFVLGVVALIGGMAIANTLTRSIVERTRDIGAMRSMGYRRSHILAMFTAEGFFLALVACAVGVALTLALTFLINQAGFYYPDGISSYPTPLRLRIVPLTYLVTAAGLCAVSTLAAFFPARGAARMPITDALSHV